MKVIGIDIDKTKAIFYALEKQADGTVHNLTGKAKTLVLQDDTVQEDVLTFLSSAHAILAAVQPEMIAIRARQTKGKFSASPLSFKVEALLQSYPHCPVKLVAPATLNAFYKKHEFPLATDHNYQEDAARLAFYLLEI